MAFTKDWADSDELLPTDSEQIKLGPAKIRDTKVAIRERLQVDHEFGTAQSGTDTGFHKKVTIKKVSGGAREPASGYAEIAYDSDTEALTIFGEGGTQQEVQDANVPIDKVIDQGGVAANGLLCKILEIGVFDTPSTTSVQVPHGLDVTKIRRVNVIIKKDGNNNLYPVWYGATSSTNYWSVDSTNVKIAIQAGYLNGTDFSDGTNRGWITIWYEA